MSIFDMLFSSQSRADVPSQNRLPVMPSNMSGPPMMGQPVQGAAPQGGNPSQGNKLMRSLAMAAAYNRNPQAGTQAILADQSRRQGADQKRQVGNMTAKWLKNNGADPSVIEMAEQGYGARAMQMHQYSQKAVKPRRVFKDAEGRQRYEGGDFLFKQDPNAPQPFNKEAFDAERNVRKEYESHDTVKAYNKVSTAFEKVRSAAMTDSGPGDISLIFNFMKMLDPSSVVRESEFATAENAGGVSETVRNIYNKVLSGERLSPEMRQEYVRTAGAIYTDTSQNMGDINKRYGKVAERWGVDPTNVTRAPEKYESLDMGQTKTVDTPSGKVTIRRVK